MKLNNLSRLTALLLALTILMSSVAWADPVAEGDYTADNYAEQLAAQTGTCEICVLETEFPTIDHRGNAITITCGYEYLKGLGSPMERYNFLKYCDEQLSSGSLSSLYSVHEQHVEAGAENLWCNCADYWATFNMPGPENHKETCPWVDGTVVIIPNIPQPDPVNPDLFEQYTSNEEYDLPMAGDRAIILPEGGRAVIKSNQAAGYQWQVYDGTQWVSIQGETGADLVVTTAKLATIFDLTSIAEIRYFDKANDVVKASVSVVSQEIAGGEYVEPVEEEAAPALYLIERDDAATTYNVIINYQYENGAIVDNPYTANLAAGSSFSATVTFPVVQGYLAYFGNDATDSTSYNLNVTNIQADVTYTVTYKPTNVEYIVYHYQQNIYDDKYSEAPSGSPDPKEGLTGTQVPAVHNTYDGFYHLLYEQPNIAADGSTKVVVYYDRYYYLMTFDLDGGYGVEPIYTRFGADIGTIPTPTKAGYIFGGWDLVSEKVDDTVTTYEDGVADEVYATMPAKNVHYKAIWTTEDTAKVTVVFWGETADCTDENKEYAYYGSGTLEYDVGEEFTYTDQTLACATEAHTHTDDCIACGKTEHQHTLENGCYTLNCDETSHYHAADGCELKCSHTAHQLSCYSSQYGELEETSAPSAELTHQGNNIYTYTSREWYGTSTHYYVKIEDKWYKDEYTDTASISFNCTHSHTDACYTCGKTEGTHTHSVEAGCYDLTCPLEVHTHTAECNGCGKPEHTHTDDCTISVSETFPTDKWFKVSSETKTVLPDGTTVVNVYYDRVEYSVQFYSRDNGNPEYTDLKITAKWGAYIEDQWPVYEGSSSWYVEKTGNTAQNGIQVMPVGGADFYGPRSGTNQSTAYYYVEVLPGEQYDVQGTDGRFYKEHHTDESTASSSTVTEEEMYAINGFTFNAAISSEDGDRFNGSKFYYTRNSYKLDFNNGLGVTKSETVLYEAPLSTYESYVPNAPSIYEPGSVAFAGWYLNPECTGAEYDLSAHTMPADNLILYAKWVPVNHTVKFYLDETKYQAKEPLQGVTPTDTYAHNALIGKISAPDNGSYKFAGWFYKDEDGTEKAFDPENMPIKQDMHVYAKWSSNVLEEYVIFYKLKDANGNPVLDENRKEIEIADQISASGLAGTTKTFDAKANDELYTGYQEGYFPLTPSHSLIIDINVPDEPNGYNWYEIDGEIVQGFTFWYVEKPAVPYRVRYLIKNEDGTTTPAIKNEDGSEFIKTVSDNKKAVVTETFEPVSGYMPDAYQKRLVVSGADGAVNEIIFYYTKDDKHAYYKITHYTQNLEGGGYTEYASSQAVGDIGTRYTGTPMTIQGFTYKEIKYFVDGVEVTGDITDKGAILTAQGLDIRLYYDRNPYPYKVQYLERGSGKVLHDPKIVTGKKYGEVVQENAIDIANYDLDSPTSQSITIQVESGDEVTRNIITFYYKEKTATINYVVVGPEDCGTVNLVGDTDDADRDDSETTKMVTGSARGATADPNDPTFKFVGWYSDEDCTQKVSDNPQYVPNQPGRTTDEDENVVNGVWPATTTYYAKFEYNLTSMKIQKAGTDIDSSETFIFTVKGEGLPEEGLKVMVNGTGSAIINGLTVGQTYTITEDTGWSWRYNPQYEEGKQAVTSAELVPDTNATAQNHPNTVTITNTQKHPYWLDGSDYEMNQFTTN